MPGLGELIFGRLDAGLAHALMSNAVKGVETLAFGRPTRHRNTAMK